MYTLGDARHLPQLLSSFILFDLPHNLLTYTKNVKPNALATLSPTTVHPVLITCLLVNWLPVSHTKCLIPFMVWKVNGKAKNAFNPIFARGDMLATAAARLADSRCQPSSGATR